MMVLDFEQMVAEVTTNKVFKQVIKRFGVSIDKREFLRYLKVDVKTVEPIYFNEMKYSKNEHGECLFIFLDKEYNIMGILKGNTWEEHKVSIFEHYHKNPKYGVIKNRKNLTEKAYHILMITPEMQVNKNIQPSKPKYTPDQLEKIKARNYKYNLESRLTKYKEEKYKNTTDEEFRLKLQEMINIVCENLYNEKFIERRKNKLKKDFYSIRTSFDLMKKLAELGSNYEDDLIRYNEIKNKDNYGFYGRDIRKHKVDLYKFWYLIKGE